MDTVSQKSESNRGTKAIYRFINDRVNFRTNRDKKEYKIFTYVSRIGFENGVNFAGMKIDSIIARISIYKWQSKREFISRARRSYRLNEFHRRETVPSYLIWTSPVPPRDSNSRFEFHGCQSKERERERARKNLRKEREGGKNEFSFARKRGGPKLTRTRVEGKKEGWIARDTHSLYIYLELCAYRALSTIRSEQVERGEARTTIVNA